MTIIVDDTTRWVFRRTAVGGSYTEEPVSRVILEHGGDRETVYQSEDPVEAARVARLLITFGGEFQAKECWVTALGLENRFQVFYVAEFDSPMEAQRRVHRLNTLLTKSRKADKEDK